MLVFSKDKHFLFNLFLIQSLLIVVGFFNDVFEAVTEGEKSPLNDLVL